MARLKTLENEGQRMIHIRLSESTHRTLRFLAVEEDTSLQQIVSDLIDGLLSRKRKGMTRR